ncbi:MAG: hypothetical protein A3K10_00615 [Bacteroidetes bacterium RIFCSPLOWO2_12_FULL_31_6]|nr:MAG: hypothetical protein A3K10_00615 [Bacteroidetes bacterium RIFCSPLOWO2_12_FULL_31_6]
MIKKIVFFGFGILISFFSYTQIEYKYKNNETYTYEETIAQYELLAKKFKEVQFYDAGKSDVGKPIFVFVISSDQDFNPKSIREKGKGILLINNAIHPGEPCGVDASVKLANDLLTNKKYAELLTKTVVCIIPFYNVDGGLNRSCCSRVNQNGPKEYGFRGNSKNLDLNRDFIKCDTKNSQTFTQLYHTFQPDVFIDTHTTDGADFQYTMSLLATQPDKLNRFLRNYLRNKMLPFLYQDMNQKNKEIIPYVDTYKDTPDDGIKDYLDSPRYSTGYTTLFNTVGFVTETLKYKPFEDRVENTYEFLMSTLKWMSDNNETLIEARKEAIESTINQTEFELGWQIDTSSYSQIDFKGYEAEYKDSEFGKDEKVLFYNHTKPYTKKINYYFRYSPTYVVTKPIAYIIPQAYTAVIDRLIWNKVELKKLQNDTTIEVEMYYINNYKTVEKPWEGHYFHYGVSLETKMMKIKFYKDDYLVFVNQSANRYIVETLEPQGMDSFFAWNFFDGILQQKEWFSDFSFEDTAKEILTSDNKLKEEFDKKKLADTEFAASRNQQLYYIYKNSAYHENTHNRYPVARLISK